MICPGCAAEMTHLALEGRLGTPLEIDLCPGCRAIWFDQYEDLRMAPAATLKVFEIISERSAAPAMPLTGALRCPRCQGRLLLTHDLQRTLARTVATPWLLATGEDFRYPTTEGGRPGPIVKLTHRYLDRVVAVATVDEVVLDAFVSVVHLVRPPSTLFKPGILARVLRGPRRPLLTAPPSSTP